MGQSTKVRFSILEKAERKNSEKQAKKIKALPFNLRRTGTDKFASISAKIVNRAQIERDLRHEMENINRKVGHDSKLTQKYNEIIQ